MADEAGWQPDPTGAHDHRYWDGTRWTEHVADAGVASTDPYVEPGGAPVSPDAPTVVTPVPAGDTTDDTTDDTTTYPVAGSPAPYAPPPPVAQGASGTGHGPSRRALAVGAALLAAVALAVVAIVALGGDDDPTGPLGEESARTTSSTTTTTEATTPSTDGGQDELPGGFPDEQIGDLLEETYGLSKEQAQCLVDRIDQAMQDDDIGEAAALSRLFEYFSDCDISLEDIAGGGRD